MPRRSTCAPRSTDYLRLRRHRQELRRVPGAARHRPDDRAGRVRLLPRALGLRQDDAAAHHRRARDADRRHASCRAGATSRGCRRPSATTASCSSRTRCSRTSRSPTTSPTASSTARRRRRRSRSAGRRAAEAGRPAGQRARSSRPSCRAASSSASRWRARSPPSPGLLLLDEPLSALDALERVRLRQEIRSLQRKLGVTTIMVTHDQEEALSVADRIVVMNQGVIEQVGTPMRGLPRPGDAVRRRLRRQDQRARRPAAARAAACASARAASPATHDADAERDVKVYLRPEDVLARPIAPGDAQRLRRRDREDRVPRLVLPGARHVAGDRRSSRSPSTCRSTSSPSRASRSAAGCRCAAARAHAVLLSAAPPTWPPSCRCRRARAAPARALDRPHRPRGAARWSRSRWSCSCSLPLLAILVKALQDTRRPLRRPRQLRRLPAHAGAAAVALEQRLGLGAGHLVTVPLAFVFAYALTRSCMPCKGAVPRRSR